VFYNGAMALDRDVHVAVTTALAAERGPFEKGWELLAATGVRGLRVLHESGGLRTLVCTEGGRDAIGVLARNAARYASEGARSQPWDSRVALAAAGFDWVDVDPFGSPLPFLDAAVAALSEGGLLSVTATDLLVLAGVQREATERRYGARPVRGRLGPEGGLRILLGAMAERAAARSLAVQPALAYMHDHYVRVYARLVRASEAPPPVGTIELDRWTGPELPGPGPLGPMWLGPLFEPAVVGRLRVPATAEHPHELTALLARWREESGADVPFYYESNSVAKATNIPSPPPTDWFVESLRAEGFRAARSAARDGAFRTNAPRERVYALARSGPNSGQSQNARVRA
jgi:tRNA (guanine26-N2/guanine27-N2)-dimethyltransferase